MLKPISTADHNVSANVCGKRDERWKMETNLTDDVKVSLGSSENAVTLADGTGIRQVSLPKVDPEGLLPCCYGKEDAENILPKFNLTRQYSLPFQHILPREPTEDGDLLLPNIFERRSSEDLTKTPTISLSKAEILIDSNSPTQIDVKWSVENAKLGSKLLFDVEIMTDTEWEFLAEKRVPVIRIYKTDQSVTLCKKKWDLTKGDTVWHVRIRPREDEMTYDWSNSIQIRICGTKMETNFDLCDKTGSILY